MRLSLLITITMFILAMILSYFQANIILVFAVVIITLILGSHLLGDATESLANYYSPALGGLLNATLGNLAELIIVFFALKEGLVEVVKASLTGSIIGNVLFVFGISLLVGGFKQKEMVLQKHEYEISSTMLLITVLLLLFPSMLFVFGEEDHSVAITITVAIGLLALYGLSLLFSFYTHKELFLTVSHEQPKMKKSQAFLLLFVSIVMLVLVSEIFAGGIEKIATSFGFGELFVGAILIGLAGNAAEHLSAIHFARKNNMSLVLNVTIGSSLQIAMFVAPLLVFISMWLGKFMTLAFMPLEIIAILASVMLMNEISRDGAVNWLEGVQLVVLYLVIAVLFFFA